MNFTTRDKCPFGSETWFHKFISRNIDVSIVSCKHHSHLPVNNHDHIYTIMDAETLTKIITKDLNIGLYPHFIGKEKSAVNNLLKERKFKYNQE